MQELCYPTLYYRWQQVQNTNEYMSHNFMLMSSLVQLAQECELGLKPTREALLAVVVNNKDVRNKLLLPVSIIILTLHQQARAQNNMCVCMFICSRSCRRI